MLIKLTKTVTPEQFLQAYEQQRVYFNATTEVLNSVIQYRMLHKHTVYAIQDNMVCGIAVYEYRAGYIFVNWLVVLSDWQGQGIGKKLLLYVALQANQRRIGLLELSYTKDSKKFYEKLGFKHDGNLYTNPKNLIRHIKQSFHLTPVEFSDMLKTYYI